MEKANFVYYQEGDLWVGWLEEYPDYRTQGKTLDELKQNLKDIYDDLDSGKIPHSIRRSHSDLGEDTSEEQLRQELIEGYQATRVEDTAINEVWETATLEKWPE